MEFAALAAQHAAVVKRPVVQRGSARAAGLCQRPGVVEHVAPSIVVLKRIAVAQQVEDSAREVVEGAASPVAANKGHVEIDGSRVVEHGRRGQSHESGRSSSDVQRPAAEIGPGPVEATAIPLGDPVGCQCAEQSGAIGEVEGAIDQAECVNIATDRRVHGVSIVDHHNVIKTRRAVGKPVLRRAPGGAVVIRIAVAQRGTGPRVDLMKIDRDARILLHGVASIINRERDECISTVGHGGSGDGLGKIAHPRVIAANIGAAQVRLIGVLRPAAAGPVSVVALASDEEGHPIDCSIIIRHARKAVRLLSKD